MYSPHSSNTAALIEAISKFPESWALTLCLGKKNLWTGWRETKLDRQQLIAAIRSQVNADGKKTIWTGVSLVSGPLSGGIMAVDFDGPLALKKYFELSGKQLPPTTKRWTSGKKGHFQILLSVPPEKWEGLQPKKIELENGEKLELRWNQCSTLPPSIHPDTQKPYIWENDGAIAECPDFILDLMRETPPVELPKKTLEQNTIYIDVEKSLVEVLENEILPRLDAEEFYGNWSALKSSGKNLKGLCPFHEEKTPSFSVTPSEKTFHCFGCNVGGGPVQFLHQIKGGTGSPTGKEFAEVVRELAAKVGVQMPEFQQNLKSNTQNQKPNTQNQKPNNLLKHPANYTPEPAPTTEIIEHADSLLEEELTPTNQIIGAIAAAKRAGLSPKDFREILAERQAEQDLDFSILDSVSKFKQLHQIQNTPIDLREFFPPALAAALLSKAESDRIDPVRILQSLLPVVGTVLGGRVGIVLKPGEEGDDAWVEYPIFYTADISPPSTGKSATQKSLLKPLMKMQAAENERLEEALLELEQIEEVWRGLSKEERAEKFDSEENPRVYMDRYCKPKKWIFNRTSAQALTKRIAEQLPMQGCLFNCDELAGLFNSLDQFTGGKGGEREFLLEAWNGPLEGSVDRVDIKSNSYTFKNQTLSLTGTMQPAVARKIFNTAADPDGMLSRFLPAISNLPDNFAKWSNVKVNLSRPMTELIENLERLPETLLTLSGPTRKIFESYWERARQTFELNLEENPAYSFFVGKQVGYVGRFAIALHCLENLGGWEIPTRVTPETMTKAVRLSLFYCNQFLLMQSKSAQQQPIEGILLDILKFVQQQGGSITTRQLCQSRFKRLQFEGKKFSAYFAQKFLQAIADAGYGTFENKTLNLLPLLPFVAGGVTALKPIDTMALSPVCRQNSKVYISENFESDSLAHTETFSDGLIDEIDSENLLENLSESENLENIGLGKTATPNPQTLMALGNDAATKRQQTATNGNKRQHLENFEHLNEDESELLGMLHTAIKTGDPVLAKNVRGSLTQVCEAGHADRKKVWDALGGENQKIFLELLKTEIPSELVNVVEKIEKTLQTEKPFLVDDLRVFTPQQVIEATKFLKPTDKAKLTRWMAIKKLAHNLVEATYDGFDAVIKVRDTQPELIEAAIERLEALKHDAVGEIRDALSEG